MSFKSSVAWVRTMARHALHAPSQAHNHLSGFTFFPGELGIPPPIPPALKKVSSEGTLKGAWCEQGLSRCHHPPSQEPSMEREAPAERPTTVQRAPLGPSPHLKAQKWVCAICAVGRRKGQLGASGFAMEHAPAGLAQENGVLCLAWVGGGSRFPPHTQPRTLPGEAVTKGQCHLWGNSASLYNTMYSSKRKIYKNISKTNKKNTLPGQLSQHWRWNSPEPGLPRTVLSPLTETPKGQCRETNSGSI